MNTRFISLAPLLLISACASFAIIPNPIIGRGKPAFSNAGGAVLAADGNFRSGVSSTAVPFWIAVNVGSGPTSLLVNWVDAYGYVDYNTTNGGAPADYQIQTSSNSTNGSDGTWATAVTVTNNSVAARAHRIPFTGQSWVRLYVTRAAQSVGIAINELVIHDCSAGCEDTWLFMGNSITAFAFSRNLVQPNYYGNLIHTANPAYFPAMLDAGVGGQPSAYGLSVIDTVLALNPDFKYFCLDYAGVDAAGNSTDTTTFKNNMQQIINKIAAAGRIPIIARSYKPTNGNYNNMPIFDVCIDHLTATNHLIAGPDLYTYFNTRAGLLQSDNIHPDSLGDVAINQLWAAAMEAAGLYTTAGVAVAPTTSAAWSRPVARDLRFVPVTSGVVSLAMFSMTGAITHRENIAVNAGTEYSFTGENLSQRSGMSNGTYMLKVQGAGVDCAFRIIR